MLGPWGEFKAGPCAALASASVKVPITPRYGDPTREEWTRRVRLEAVTKPRSASGRRRREMGKG